MAVQSREENTRAKSGDVKKPTIISLEELASGKTKDGKSLATGKVSKIDVTQDAWERVAPPYGRQRLKLFIAKDGITTKLADEGDLNSVFYSVQLEGKIVDGPFEGQTVFVGGMDAPNTRIRRGKQISTMAGLLVKMGKKIPEEITDLDQLKLFGKVMKSEPIVGADIEWQARSKNDKDRNGYDKTVFSKREQFPEGEEEGEHLHICTITNADGGREEITARAYIRGWLSAGEMADGAGTGTGTAAGTAGTSEPVKLKKAKAKPPEDEDDDDGDLTAAQKAALKAVSGSGSDEDEED